MTTAADDQPTPERHVPSGEAPTGTPVPTYRDSGVLISLHNGCFHWAPDPAIGHSGVGLEAATSPPQNRPTT